MLNNLGKEGVKMAKRYGCAVSSLNLFQKSVCELTVMLDEQAKKSKDFKIVWLNKLDKKDEQGQIILAAIYEYEVEGK